MANEKKKKDSPRGAKSEALENATAVIESADKIKPAVKDARDPMEALTGLVDLYKTKATIKGFQVMEKELNHELSDEPQEATAQQTANRSAGPGMAKQTSATPLAQILPLVGEDKRDELVSSIVKAVLDSDDKDAVYELLAGQNPNAKRLLGALKPQQTQKPATQPGSDFESMSNAMMNMMKMMGLGTLMKSEGDSNNLTNMMAMFNFMKEFNKKDDTSDRFAEMLRTIHESNQTMMQTIQNGNRELITAVTGVLGNVGNSNAQIEFMKTIFEKDVDHRNELMRQQLENINSQIGAKEQFWQAQYDGQAEIIKGLKAQVQAAANMPRTGGTDPRVLNELMAGIKELKQNGLLKQEEDKEIQLKRIETEADLKKMDKDIAAKQAQTQTLTTMAALVTKMLDAPRQKAAENAVNPSKPSQQASKMAGVPISAQPAAISRGVS